MVISSLLEKTKNVYPLAQTMLNASKLNTLTAEITKQVLYNLSNTNVISSGARICHWILQATYLNTPEVQLSDKEDFSTGGDNQQEADESQ